MIFSFFQNNWGIYTYSMNVHTSYAIWGECLTILIRMSVHWRTTGAWGWDWDRMCRNRGRRFILITRAWNHQNNSMSCAVFDLIYNIFISYFTASKLPAFQKYRYQLTMKCEYLIIYILYCQDKTWITATENRVWRSLHKWHLVWEHQHLFPVVSHFLV